MLHPLLHPLLGDWTLWGTDATLVVILFALLLAREWRRPPGPPPPPREQARQEPNT